MFDLIDFLIFVFFGLMGTNLVMIGEAISMPVMIVSWKFILIAPICEG